MQSTNLKPPINILVVFCYILNNYLYISCMKDEHKEYLALAVLAVALMAVGGFIVFLASELAKPY